MQGRLKKTYYFGHASTLHEGIWPATVVGTSLPVTDACHSMCLTLHATADADLELMGPVAVLVRRCT
jgi:hypothetical protein